MQVLNSTNTWNIICETLSRIDPRLVDHGKRVSFIAYKIMSYQNNIPIKDFTKRMMTCLLHDIGAYKTDEIDDMLDFEIKEIWNHSIYGSLFLLEMSPLKEYAQAVLHHHTNYRKLKDLTIPESQKEVAALIKLCDKIDFLYRSNINIYEYLNKQRNVMFSGTLIDIFIKLDQSENLIQQLKNKSYHYELDSFIATLEFTKEEKAMYLGVIAYSIDFRSEFMVQHTITTVSVAQVIGHYIGLSNQQLEKLYFGSLLHDIGKVATPIEILEKPGRLTHEEMEIMKMHVTITGEILSTYVDSEVYNIATRHHEKMDGSGYPIGLTRKDLTIEQRICAIADILSALIRKRSYKEAFDLNITKQILITMMNENKICPDVTTCVIAHFNEIIELVNLNSKKFLNSYYKISRNYKLLISELNKGNTPLIQNI